MNEIIFITNIFNPETMPIILGCACTTHMYVKGVSPKLVVNIDGKEEIPVKTDSGKKN